MIVTGSVGSCNHTSVSHRMAVYLWRGWGVFDDLRMRLKKE